MNTIKILIVEDEAVIAEHLKMMLENSGFANIELAYNKESAINFLTTKRPDLILLDIHMQNELDGIELADHINAKYKIPFIFITAHSDNLIISKATKTKPEAYITKPFKNADVFAAVNIAVNNSTKTENLFSFKDGYDEIFLKNESILFIKSEKNYIDLVTVDKKYTLRNSLEWFLQTNTGKEFKRIHRSFIININHVNKLSSSSVEIDGFSIPISRKYLAELRQLLK
jgi:DNA-binding LytR/AlgR family response regulator